MRTDLVSSASKPSACLCGNDVMKTAHICSALLAIVAFGLMFAGAFGALSATAVYVSGGVGGISTIAFGILEDIRSEPKGTSKEAQNNPRAKLRRAPGRVRVRDRSFIPPPSPPPLPNMLEEAINGKTRAPDPRRLTSDWLLQFYTSNDRNRFGDTYQGIMDKDYRWLETMDYIEWLFPTRGCLNDETLVLMRTNDEIRVKVERAFLKMLGFYGLQRSGSGDIERGGNWNVRQNNWILHPPGRHNFGRIAHILRSLKALEFDADVQAFLSQLRTIQRDYSHIVTVEVLQMWETAASLKTCTSGLFP